MKILVKSAFAWLMILSLMSCSVADILERLDIDFESDEDDSISETSCDEDKSWNDDNTSSNDNNTTTSKDNSGYNMGVTKYDFATPGEFNVYTNNVLFDYDYFFNAIGDEFSVVNMYSYENYARQNSSSYTKQITAELIQDVLERGDYEELHIIAELLPTDLVQDFCELTNYYFMRIMSSHKAMFYEQKYGYLYHMYMILGFVNQDYYPNNELSDVYYLLSEWSRGLSQSQTSELATLEETLGYEYGKFQEPNYKKLYIDAYQYDSYTGYKLASEFNGQVFISGNVPASGIGLAQFMGYKKNSSGYYLGVYKFCSDTEISEYEQMDARYDMYKEVSVQTQNMLYPIIDILYDFVASNGLDSVLLNYPVLAADEEKDMLQIFISPDAIPDKTYAQPRLVLFNDGTFHGRFNMFSAVEHGIFGTFRYDGSTKTYHFSYVFYDGSTVNFTLKFNGETFDFDGSDIGTLKSGVSTMTL